MSTVSARDRTFLERTVRMELSGGEAELADWCASRYGNPGDGETLRWFLLYLLWRHGQGDLMIPDPDADPHFQNRFMTLVPVEEPNLRDYLHQMGTLIQNGFTKLVERNDYLIAAPEQDTLIIRFCGACRFRRFWKREESLLTRLEQLLLSGSGDSTPGNDPLDAALSLLSRNRLLLISGGPGTGKTTLIGKIAAAWISRFPAQGGTPRLLLAAPTGRAASRLLEALPAGEGIPDTAQTLHKLLKFRFDGRGPLHGPDYPLPADLVIVDEASMIDVNMMDSLFGALPGKCPLILVGDRDQLPSVGAGALFSDFLEGVENPEHRLNGRVVLLDKVHRSIPGLTRLASAVREGDFSGMLSLLRSEDAAVEYKSLPEPSQLFALLGSLPRVGETLREPFFDVPPGEWHRVRDKIAAGLADMGRTGILTPVRKGPYGTEHLNALMERRAATQHGRPVMITANNYELELFNGDRGMIFLFREVPLAFFSLPSGELRAFPPGRLEGLETCYVQTVHKSQGSEYRHVVLFYPEVNESLLTREILYTGITRAREQLTLLSEDPLLESGLGRRVLRASRVREYLSGSPAR